MTQVKPKMDHSERAARDLLNLKVREGLIDRPNANQILKVGLPFVRMMLARWRREGTSPQWLTDKFQSKLTEAKEQYAAAGNDFAKHRALLGIVGAEMYLAVWAGLQADLAQFIADDNASRQSIEA